MLSAKWKREGGKNVFAEKQRKILTIQYAQWYTQEEGARIGTAEKIRQKGAGSGFLMAKECNRLHCETTKERSGTSHGAEENVWN